MIMACLLLKLTMARSMVIRVERGWFGSHWAGGISQYRPKSIIKRDNGASVSRDICGDSSPLAPPPNYGYGASKQPPLNKDVTFLPQEQINPPPNKGNSDGGSDKRSKWWLLPLAGLLVSATGVVLAIAAGGVVLKFNHWRKFRAIDSRIKKGSCPGLSVDHNWKVDRQEVIDQVVEKFIEIDGSDKFFGIVLGPMGTGKTQLIREVCQSREGCLYFELDGAELFPERLADALGMRMKPTAIDVLLGKYFSSTSGFFTLPANYLGKLTYVINKLAERSEVFKNKTGRPPCLFIDGVDLLSKHGHKDEFVKLVDIAKHCAEEGNLRIVFGCSEGHIIPVINADNTSSKSRVEILEILDLPYDMGMSYLRKRGLPDELSKRVIDFSGSRMLFLTRAARTYKLCKNKDMDHVFAKIIGVLRQVFLQQAIDAAIDENPLFVDILEHLQKFDDEIGFDVHDYLMSLEKDLRKKCKEVIDGLVNGNALRYTFASDSKSPLGETLHVTWHSQLVKKELIKLFKHN